MSDPIFRNLQKLNQAKADYDASLLAPKSIAPTWFYEGFDPNRGKLTIKTAGNDRRQVEPITTGGIARGDRISLKGGTADAMHYTESRLIQPAKPREPTIQTSFVWGGGVYIGGDRQTPKLIYTLLPGESVQSLTHNNAGKGRFFAGLRVTTGTGQKCLSINDRGVFYEFENNGDREIAHIGRFYWAEAWGTGVINRFFPQNDVDTGGSVGSPYTWNPLNILGDQQLPTALATRSVSGGDASANIPSYILPGIQNTSVYNRSDTSTTYDYTIPLIVGQNVRSVVYIRFTQSSVRWFYYDADAGTQVEILNGIEAALPPIDSPNPLIGQGNLIRGVYSPYLAVSQEDLKTKKKIPVKLWDLRGEDGSQVTARSRTVKVNHYPITESRYPGAVIYWNSYHP